MRTTGIVTPERVTAIAALLLQTERGVPLVPEPFHLLWLHLLTDPTIKDLMIVGSPGIGKTLWIVAYLLALIAANPESPIIFASTTGSVASQRSQAIRQLVEGERFRWIFPDIQAAQGMRRAVDEWSVAPDGKPFDGRIHATMRAYGTGARGMIGARAKVIIGDDLIDNESSRSPTRRAEARRWFHNSLYTRRSAGGLVRVIGNVWHSDDLHAHLARSENFVTCRIPLLSDGPNVYATLTYPDDYTGVPIGTPVADNVAEIAAQDARELLE